MQHPIYNIDYWDTMIRQNSSTAKEIAETRWDFVSILEPKVVLDYGCGPGWFRAFALHGVQVDTFDLYPWPQTGINHDHYDLITLWDVLEHVEDLDQFVSDLCSKADNIALTTPILPNEATFELKKWKHYKPGEHLHYFTVESLTELFAKHGFILIKIGDPECPPRSDVASFIFAKKSDDQRGVRHSASGTFVPAEVGA